jgi:hypothetical protein
MYVNNGAKRSSLIQQSEVRHGQLQGMQILQVLIDGFA